MRDQKPRVTGEQRECLRDPRQRKVGCKDFRSLPLGEEKAKDIISLLYSLVPRVELDT